MALFIDIISKKKYFIIIALKIKSYLKFKETLSKKLMLWKSNEMNQRNKGDCKGEEGEWERIMDWSEWIGWTGMLIQDVRVMW